MWGVASLSCGAGLWGGGGGGALAAFCSPRPPSPACESLNAKHCARRRRGDAEGLDQTCH